MKHKTVKRKLLRYLDNDLPEGEFKAVRQHLSTCPECSNYLQQLEKIWFTEQPVTPIEVPPFLWTRLSVRLQTGIQPTIKNRYFAVMNLFIKRAWIPEAVVITIFTGIKFGSEMHQDALKGNYETTIVQDFGLNYFSLMPPGYVGESIIDYNTTKK